MSTPEKCPHCGAPADGSGVWYTCGTGTIGHTELCIARALNKSLRAELEKARAALQQILTIAEGPAANRRLMQIANPARRIINICKGALLANGDNVSEHFPAISWTNERNQMEETKDIGWAIRQLKSGNRVRRSGWNGKGMYLWLLPAATVKAEWCREPHLKAVAEANGGEIAALGSIRMMTADRKVLTGWLASQTDMLSEDWEKVD